MATDDQHDTLVLPRPSAPQGPVSTAAQAQSGAGWQPVATAPAPTPWDTGAWRSADWSLPNMTGASAWSQVPPFVPQAPPPVLVMRNNAAVIGATLGSVALVVSLIPLIGIIAWVLAPIGLLSSGIGVLVGASRRVGRVAAVWGLLSSGGALLVCMAWVALILAI